MKAFLLFYFLFSTLFSAPFLYVAISGSNDVCVIDTATDTVVVQSIPVDPLPQSIAVTANGRKCYVSCLVAGAIGTVVVIDNFTHTVTKTLTVGMQPRMIAITPDDKYAYVVNQADNSVSIIDVAADTVINNLMIMGNSPISLAISSDSQQVYIPAASNVTQIPTATNTIANTIPTGSFPNYCAVTLTGPNGLEIYAPNLFDNNVTDIFYVAGVPMTMTIGSGGMRPTFPALTPDGKSLYVTNRMSNDVGLILNNMLQGMTIPVGTGPMYMIILPDGSKGYVSSSNETVTSFTIPGHATTTIGPFSLGESPNFLISTPDSLKVYVCDEGGSNVRVIDTMTDSLSLPILVGSGVGVPVSAAIGGTPIPNVNGTVSGTQVKNRFLTQTDLINVINWTASPSAVNYQIFRNESLTDLAGSVSAEGPLEFQDHNRIKNQIYSYYVEAVDENGDRLLIGNTSVP